LLFFLANLASNLANGEDPMKKISHAASPPDLALAKRFWTLTAVCVADERSFLVLPFVFFGG